jgi:DNA-binding Lrp family transcriptional regulator/DNA-binding PadR family transcriptional regulator
MTNIRAEVLTFNPKVAEAVGLTEAIILNQIDYWLEKNKESGKNIYDGLCWVFNTYDNWKKSNFSFLSESTIYRAIKKLEKAKLIFTTSKYNKKRYDKTKWYSINYEEVEKLLEKATSQIDERLSELPEQNSTKSQIDEKELVKLTKATSQIDEMDLVKLTRPIPEITTEITSEINKESNKDSSKNILRIFAQIFENEILNHIPQEIKTECEQPINKFIIGYHLSTNEINENVNELIADGIKRAYADYETNNMDSFKGLVYRYIENNFLDSLLMIKGIDTAELIKNKRIDQLKKLRINARMEWLQCLSTRGLTEEMAATLEQVKTVKPAKSNKKKAAQPKKNAWNGKKKPIRTELLPEWFDKPYEAPTPTKEQEAELEKKKQELAAKLAAFHSGVQNSAQSHL